MCMHFLKPNTGSYACLLSYNAQRMLFDIYSSMYILRIYHLHCYSYVGVWVLEKYTILLLTTTLRIMQWSLKELHVSKSERSCVRLTLSVIC